MIEVRIEAGPDAGRSATLPPGRHRIGRAAAGALVLRDPAVEAHHAVVEVAANGAVAVTQLAGRAPIAVEQRRAGTVVEIGHSRVVLSAPAGPAPAPAPACTRPVRVPVDRADVGRFVAELASWSASPPAPPAGSFVVGLGTGRVARPLQLVDGDGAPVDAAALPLELQPVVDRAGVDAGAPVTIDLGAHRAIAVRGAGAMAVVRSLVGQIAAHAAPCRWRLVAALSGHDEDGWLVPLARRVPVDRPLGRLVVRPARPGGRCVLVVTDRPHLLDDALRLPAGVTVLVALDDGAPLPATCGAVIELGARWRARWIPDVARPDLATVRAHAAGWHPDTLARAVAALPIRPPLPCARRRRRDPAPARDHATSPPAVRASRRAVAGHARSACSAPVSVGLRSGPGPPTEGGSVER